MKLSVRTKLLAGNLYLHNIASSEMEKRYARFDVLALQKVAAGMAGAATCTSMEKIAEGKADRLHSLATARICYLYTFQVLTTKYFSCDSTMTRKSLFAYRVPLPAPRI